MPEALTALAARYPKRSIRNRLRHMWFRVAEGRDWCESLLASRLLRPAEAGVLQSAARAGNLPWAMREMADSNRRRFAYRLSAILQVVFPATLCMIGLAVGSYVVACFLPLISLIEYLSK
jgi:type II secretory pathway component PulF